MRRRFEMRRIALAVSAVGLFATNVALAHEGHAHKLMGTVKAVHAERNHVEVETKDGKTSGFYVDPATRYLKGGAPAALSDVAVGTRVVVTTKMEGKKAIATEVKIGDGASGKDPGPKASPHQH
jgi:hypothetical protein